MIVTRKRGQKKNSNNHGRSKMTVMKKLCSRGFFSCLGFQEEEKPAEPLTVTFDRRNTVGELANKWRLKFLRSSKR